ncbi:hypothetical protein PENSPDRAFT_685963 [Peniophora sp. CONT]|nr:hypothetical protein PENSPDRAFT_685963 [Peniophora sp. CONT]
MTGPIAGPSSAREYLARHGAVQSGSRDTSQKAFKRPGRTIGSLRTRSSRNTAVSSRELEQRFSRLSTKAAVCMGQLLQTEDTMRFPPVRWTNFCKMMGEMGFSIDHSITGSSSRFDPPDGLTRSISLRMPQPDPFIEPETLCNWGRRLEEYYGWDKETFEQARLAVNEKKGFFRKAFNHFGGHRQISGQDRPDGDTEQRLANSFAGLSKKAAVCMSHVLQTQSTRHPPMLWTDFCKMMVEMGFNVHHTTNSLATRFDPPDGTTRSISLHKPHPEQHIEPVILRIWGKKLKEYYCWNEELFVRHVMTLPGGSTNDDRTPKSSSRPGASHVNRVTAPSSTQLTPPVVDVAPHAFSTDTHMSLGATSPVGEQPTGELSTSSALSTQTPPAILASAVISSVSRIAPTSKQPPIVLMTIQLPVSSSDQEVLHCGEPSVPIRANDTAPPTTITPALEPRPPIFPTVPDASVGPDSTVAPESPLGEDESVLAIEAVPLQQPGTLRASATRATDPLTLVHLSLSSLSGTAAQSGRGYLKQSGSENQGKVKTRKVVSDVSAVAEPAKKGFLDRLRGGKGKGKEMVQEIEAETLKVPRIFGKIGRKVADAMSQVLQTKDAMLRPRRPMRWTTFCKNMTKLGFKVDQATGSSSTCFTPVSGLLQGRSSVSFHKPHARGTSTIEPITLEHWGKTLKEVYPDWTEDLMAQLEAEDDFEP